MGHAYLFRLRNVVCGMGIRITQQQTKILIYNVLCTVKTRFVPS